MVARVATACFVLSMALGQYAVAGSDFNGDGADDLVIGTPAAAVFSVESMGSVHVLYGAPVTGVSTAGSQILTIVNLGPVTDPQVLTAMNPAAVGYSIAAGDFNGDGFDDLAVSAPGMTVGNVEGAGIVYVVPGSPTGLLVEKRKVLHQNVKGVKGKAQEGDAFGIALACGNFNGDKFDDLAVGVLETVKGFDDSGSVAVFRGSKAGLRAQKNQLWSQASKGVPGDPGLHLFGVHLGAGDLNGDGRDELVVGAAFELDGNANLGVWTILFGSKKGLTAKHVMRIDLAQLGGESPNSPFGECDCGDVNGDGFDDLALSWPSCTAASTVDAGILAVLPGSATGPQVAAATILHQSSVGVDGTAAAGDSFASSLVCADFDGDGFADVACGNPHDDDSGPLKGGSVEVFFGSASGLTTTGEDLIHEDTLGMADAVATQDLFGLALGAGDFDGNGAADLAVGVPGELVNAQVRAGAVHILPGVLGLGVSASLSTFWNQDTPGVVGTATAEARFGSQFANSR